MKDSTGLTPLAQDQLLASSGAVLDEADEEDSTAASQTAKSSADNPALL